MVYYANRWLRAGSWRVAFVAVLAVLAFGGSVQARPWLAMHRAVGAARLDAQRNARLDGGVGYVTGCHRVHRAVVECVGHEDGIRTPLVDGRADLVYGAGVRLIKGRVVLRTPFL